MPYSTNYPLRAAVENDSSLLTRDIDTDPFPRSGETELARIVRVYGIDYALDIFEQGAVEDGYVSTIVIYGHTGCKEFSNSSDPLFVNGGDKIRKQMLSSDLPATRERWNELGRSITNVVTVERIS